MKICALVVSSKGLVFFHPRTRRASIKILLLITYYTHSIASHPPRGGWTQNATRIMYTIRILYKYSSGNQQLYAVHCDVRINGLSAVIRVLAVLCYYTYYIILYDDDDDDDLGTHPYVLRPRSFEREKKKNFLNELFDICDVFAPPVTFV